MSKTDKSVATRNYAVRELQTGKLRIINAKTRNTARGWAADSAYSVEVATAADGFELASKGGTIEYAGDPQEELVLPDPPPHPTP